MEKKQECVICYKTLVPIGTSRRKGTTRHHDWDTRVSHKKCWKNANHEEMVKIMECQIEKRLEMKKLEKNKK